MNKKSAAAFVAQLSPTTKKAHAIEAVLALVELDHRPAATAVKELAQQYQGVARAVLSVAASILAETPHQLIDATQNSPTLLEHSAKVILRVRRGLPELRPLYRAWIELVSTESARRGSGAFRALLGDVCEALFRQAQLGVALEDELNQLSDIVSAELPGTTDFLAARAMVWLLGCCTLEDGARAAIEKARGRFFDPAFQKDCDAILSGKTWPPRV